MNFDGEFKRVILILTLICQICALGRLCFFYDITDKSQFLSSHFV